MTNEMAIKLLDEITSYCDFTDEYGDMIDSEPYHEALDLAIKALEEKQEVDYWHNMANSYEQTILKLTKALETHEERIRANNDSKKTHECDCRCHLTDRPCSVCEYHTDNGCSKWSCVFEED